MKFYYNGQKVRESKTHEYHYGLKLWDGRIKACSVTRDGLHREIAYFQKRFDSDLEYMRRNNYPAAEIEAKETEIAARIAAMEIVELEARA